MARLIDSGIGPEHIGYLEPLDERESKDPAKGAAEGIAVGATSGAVVGAILAAAAVGLIPGVGPALVAGALLPVLLGTVGGAVTGATAGGLLGGDVSSDEEPYFMQEVHAGRILVSAEVEPGETDATTRLLSSAALEVDRLGTATLHARLRHPAGDDAKG